MKKINSKTLSLLAASLLMIVLVAGGCAKAPEKGTTEQSATDTLSELLGMGSSISSVKYDVTMTMPGAPQMTLKTWLKKNKMKTEMRTQGQTAISLMDMDAKTMYTYMPAQNMAIKMKWDDTSVPTSPTENLEVYKPVHIGTETLDGKVCTVIEYNAEGTKTKSWIWKKNGFPVRTEAVTPEGTVIMEYKNIQFTDIPDSVFELPAGVSIMEMPTGMQ
ncbi:MAG: DUF4412 domain-containing protein [Patescibacteria group bacterium]|nr:DUF4412 domain-containing protein [Patescibacteria group bacterium]